MFYSIFPPSFDDLSGQSSQREYQCKVYNGTLISYYVNEDGKEVTERVLSTNLKDYLDVGKQPGQVIN